MWDAELYQEFRQFVGRHRRRLGVALSLMLIALAGQLLAPFVMVRTVNAIARYRRAEAELWLGLILAGALVKALCSFTSRELLGRVSSAAGHEVRQQVFARTVEAPMDAFDREGVTGLLTRYYDLWLVQVAIHPGLVDWVGIVVAGVGAVACMLYLNLWLSLVALLPLGPAFWMISGSNQRRVETFQQSRVAYAALLGAARESLAGIRTVRAFAQEEAQGRRFAQLSLAHIDRVLLESRLGSRHELGMQLLLGLNGLLVLWLGSLEMAAGRLSLGGYLAFNTYMFMFAWPLHSMGSLTSRLQAGLASLRALKEYLGPPSPNGDCPGPGQPRAEAPLVSVRNLSFAYPTGPPALDGLSFELRAGERVGLIGPSGCGKSTLAALLARLYESPPESVWLEGAPLEHFPLSAVRSAVGLVGQQPYVFSDTLRANLVWGRDAGDREIEAALKTACLDREVSRFSRGLDTHVGEKGIKLSGGQRQRLCLARALLWRPSLLVLDDCLSNVDAVTEAAILEQLLRPNGSRALLLISQRVSTVCLADRILVMDGGRVVDEGSHAELLRRSELYSGLARRQQGP